MASPQQTQFTVGALDYPIDAASQKPDSQLCSFMHLLSCVKQSVQQVYLHFLYALSLQCWPLQ